MENYQIDNLDRGILEALMANARTAYAELAKQFGVSPGTIHVRVEKMKQAGIITGARIDVSPKYLCQQLVAGMNWYMGRKLTYRMEEAVR